MIDTDCNDLKDPSESSLKALTVDKTIFFLLKNQLLDDFHLSGGRVKKIKEFLLNRQPEFRYQMDLY